MCISCLKEKNLEYENIHCHSFYSNISTPDSVTSRKQVAERAVELGHHTISTVEHGYGGNVFDVYTIAKNLGLKLIFGTEFYYVKDRFEKDKTNSHILVVAKNENGREAMNMLISEANTTGFYMKPRIDEELLFSLPKDDVIVTTACIASPINKYDEDYAHHFLSRGKEYFGDNFFLEVQPHTHNLQIQFNKKLIEYNKKYNIDFILGVDSHYIYEKDAEMRDIFLRSKDINYPEEDGFILDFPTVDTIIDRFDVQNVLNAEQLTQAFNNTLIVRDFEGVKINDDIKMISIYPDLTHEQKTQKLKDLINREWKKDRAHIDKSEWKKYIDAIKFETDIIVGTNMEDYFLFNHKMIERGVNEYGGILTKTGRGSAPSMYVNKLFGFTEIDRIEAPIELYPTRFMSKSRILETKSLPDIDYNTADTEPFIKASKDILGDNHCYQMIAFGTMQEKDAFKSYCRGLGIPLNEVVPISEDLDSYRKHKQWGRIIERSQKFIGVITSYSPHPCANLLLNEDIRKSIGTIKAKDGQQLALIDSYNSDVYKYLKNDLLTVTVYGIIGNVYKSIGKPIDDVRTLIKNTKDDKRIWKLFEDGIVATLNQAGTNSGKPQIMQYKPKSIRDLSMWVAAIRPSFATLKDTFLTRKEFSYGIPEFDKLLKSSDNFILFQENIMTVLQYVGFPEDETYGLLKAIAKKKPGIIEPIHDRFIKGFVEKTGSENDALEVWKIIENAVG